MQRTKIDKVTVYAVNDDSIENLSERGVITSVKRRVSEQISISKLGEKFEMFADINF